MHETGERGLPRALKATLAGVLIVLLLALVAIGSRGSHPSGSYHSTQREVPAVVGNDLLTLVIVVYGIGLVILVAAFLVFRHEWVTPRSRWLRDLFVTLAVCCFLTLVGYRLFHNDRRPHRGEQVAQQTRTGQPAQTDRRQTLPKLAAPRKPAHFDWEFAAVLGGLVVLTAAYFLGRGRRVPPSQDDEAIVTGELETVISDAIDDLRREADPRRAVIAAYARMEGVLGRHGRARHVAEAPYEYLGRVLLDSRVSPDAVAELTELYERAKFSPHRVDGEMKARAIWAFASVRDDLRATT